MEERTSEPRARAAMERLPRSLRSNAPRYFLLKTAFCERLLSAFWGGNVSAAQSRPSFPLTIRKMSARALSTPGARWVWDWDLGVSRLGFGFRVLAFWFSGFRDWGMGLRFSVFDFLIVDLGFGLTQEGKGAGSMIYFFK